MSEFDFDKFLQESVEQEDNSKKVAEALARQSAYIHNEINSRGIYCLVDADEDVTLRNIDEAAMEMREAVAEGMIANLAQTGERLPDDFDEQVGATAFHYAQQLAIAQHQSIALIHMELAVSEVEFSVADNLEAFNEAMANATSRKKRLVASMMVKNDLDFSDPWVQLANDIVPGEPLDLEKDGEVIAGVTAEYARQEADRAQLSEVSDQILEILHEYIADDETRLNVISKVATVVVVIGAGSADEFYAKREATIYEAFRVAGLDQGPAQEVLALLNEKYPFQG